MKLIFDAHLDLAMNAMEWNRDLRQSVLEIRKREEGMADKPDRGKGTVAFPELRKGNVGIVVATQIARYVSADNPLPGWFSQQQAWAQTQGQLAWYRAMEEEGHLRQIKDLAGLEDHLNYWGNNPDKEDKPIGYILSLEGADSIFNMDQLTHAYAQGLRALGPAHYGPGVYANGTDATGGLNSQGKRLLEAMEEMNIILDVTHLCDDSFWDALDYFRGPVWASHSNCRALVDHNRQLNDEQIKALVQRQAVIGGALDAWMMVPGWKRGESTPSGKGVNLEVLIDHLDHICQLAGNSRCVGIGTDLDGAFGKEQCPYDLETISDMQKLEELLKQRGYTDEDINNILNANWIDFLRRAWKVEE